MNSVIRYRTALRTASISLCAGACILGLTLFLATLFRLKSAGSVGQQAAVRSLSWPKPSNLTQLDWSVFRINKAGAVESSGGSLSRRYRLAGTYPIPNMDGRPFQWKAVVHDTESNSQQNVGEGELVGGAEVISITEGAIILSAGGRQERIERSVASTDGIVSSASASSRAKGLSWLDINPTETVLSTNNFGAKVGEQRWVMSRSRLEDYCVAVEDDPSRMVPLFDSMKPEYEYNGDRRRVTGYRLKIEGEREFYESVGLREGDVVKRVNEMPITSKRRAMFMINQFRDSNLNTVMMDVVRNGQETRLEYQIR